jgi:hypothetical protein
LPYYAKLKVVFTLGFKPILNVDAGTTTGSLTGGSGLTYGSGSFSAGGIDTFVSARNAGSWFNILVPLPSDVDGKIK